MAQKHLAQYEIRAMGYWELCGKIDMGHPQANELKKECEVREMANPKFREMDYMSAR